MKACMAAAFKVALTSSLVVSIVLGGKTNGVNPFLTAKACTQRTYRWSCAPLCALASLTPRRHEVSA